jgi:hypothetical protein
MTIIRVLPTLFTGGNSATLPILPYSLGVTQPKYRWLAAQQSTLGAITSVAPAVGVVPLTGTATVASTATGNVLTTNGTSNFLAATGVTDVKTLMIIGRVTAATGTAQGIANANFGLSTATDGRARLAASGFTTQFLAPLLNDPGDHVIIVSTDGTTLTYRLDAVTGAAATTAAAGGALEVGRASVSGAIYGAMTIREVVGWTTALTAADMTTLRTKAKDNYSTITA